MSNAHALLLTICVLWLSSLLIRNLRNLRERRRFRKMREAARVARGHFTGASNAAIAEFAIRKEVGHEPGIAAGSRRSKGLGQGDANMRRELKPGDEIFYYVEGRRYRGRVLEFLPLKARGSDLEVPIIKYGAKNARWVKRGEVRKAVPPKGGAL